jgi:lipid A biosynthesis lauroyl/palmitoleoyl acyltransferase
MENYNFLHPKFWLTWVIIGIMHLAVFIPFKLQLIISKIFSYLFIILAYKKYQIAKINISKCFPELDKSSQNKIIKQHFADFFMSLFETAMCFYTSSRRLKKLYQFDNKHILQQALDNNDNVILLAGHFTTLMITGRFLTDNFQVANIYRPQNNKLFGHIMVKSFECYGAKMVNVRDNKSVIRTLKNGIPIWYAPDQDLGNKAGVFAPFFGVPANTLTSTAKLAKMANAKVIAFNFYRHKDGYNCSFEEIKNFPIGDDLTDATTINKVIEGQILLAPSQYLWTHRRFKTRPKGEKSLY